MPAQQPGGAAAEAEEVEEEAAADYLSASSGSGFSDGGLVYEQEQASPNVQPGEGFHVHLHRRALRLATMHTQLCPSGKCGWSVSCVSAGTLLRWHTQRSGFKAMYRTAANIVQHSTNSCRCRGCKRRQAAVGRDAAVLRFHVQRRQREAAGRREAAGHGAEAAAAAAAGRGAQPVAAAERRQGGRGRPWGKNAAEGTGRRGQQERLAAAAQARVFISDD